MSLSETPSLTPIFQDLRQMSVSFALRHSQQRCHADLLSLFRCLSQIGKVRYASRCSYVATDTCTHQYVFLGAYTMLLYDHLLTLPEEVRNPSPNTVPSSTLIPCYPIAGSNGVEEEENIPCVVFKTCQKLVPPNSHLTLNPPSSPLLVCFGTTASNRIPGHVCPDNPPPPRSDIMRFSL
jgi:hypothetical protein